MSDLLVPILVDPLEALGYSPATERKALRKRVVGVKLGVWRV